MFEHSIKVPRLYKTAAKIVKEASETGASIKQLVYEAKHVRVTKIYRLETCNSVYISFFFVESQGNLRTGNYIYAKER